jgi:hypothetical protein
MDVDFFLGLLGEHLAYLGADHIELAVCGGSALNALGLVTRTTEDVDIFAFVEDGLPIACREMPPILRKAADRVAADYNLTEEWLNLGPSSIMDLGLPAGLSDRWHRREYGPRLAVCFIDRFDQIHFKLYAAVDQDRSSVHFSDLQTLHPEKEEIIAAARWTLTHDVSVGFRSQLIACIRTLGFTDVAEEL